MKLIYFSPVSWDSFTQRPHEFVHYFHDIPLANVIWVNPYATRLPQVKDFFRLKNREKSGVREIPSWLTVLSSSCLPVEPIWWLRFLNSWSHSQLLKKLVFCVEDFFVIGKPSLLALYSLDRLQPSNSIYDAMDDFPEFYTGISAQHMANVELNISKKINKIIVSSQNLQKKFLNIGINSQLVLNACSLVNIGAYRKITIKTTKLVVGYVGTIAQWFDWGVVITLARQNDWADFHLIGPIIGFLPVNMPSNIKIFPPVSHEKAMAAMAQFSIGIIPFKNNKLTHCVDPIKYYEYKAFGLPIISTDFGEMSYRKNEKGVYVINADFESFSLALKTLKKPDFSEVFSWQDRFKNVFNN